MKSHAQIIFADEGKNNQQIADQFDLHSQTFALGADVGRSGAIIAHRFSKAIADWHEMIHEVLRDNPRSGTPATFTAEQICQIVAVGEPPLIRSSGEPLDTD